MIFSAARMLSRIKSEGRMDMVDEEIRSIMNKLDGKEAKKNDFRALVYGEQSFFVTDDDGKQYPVNEIDCIN